METQILIKYFWEKFVSFTEDGFRLIDANRCHSLQNHLQVHGVHIPKGQPLYTYIGLAQAINEELQCTDDEYTQTQYILSKLTS